MKYIYKFCVYANNCRDGVKFITAFASLSDALYYKAYLQNTGGGCCDVVKKRFLKGSTTPLVNNIYSNTKYIY